MNLSISEKKIIYKKFNILQDAISGFVGNIDILIKLKISLDTPFGNEKDNPLTVCCKNGSYFFLEKLIKEKVNIEYKNKHNLTGLMLASQYGYPNMVKLLIENGAKIDNRDKINNNTALMLACIKGNLKCVEILLENGASLNEIGNNGYTPFLMAVKSKNFKLVEFLVDKVDVNYKTELSNETALMIASRNNSLKIVKLLIRKGADQCIKEKFNGYDAKMIAKMNNNNCVYYFLSRMKRKRKFDVFK